MSHRNIDFRMSPLFRWSALFALLLIFEPLSYALPPTTVNYQGYLTDDAGAPITSPPDVNLTFRLYTTSSGGSMIWGETQTVTINQGLFNVELGSITPLNLPADFNTPLYLGIEVGSDGEMSPRRPITLTGYSIKAMDADTLEGFSAAELDQSAHVLDYNNPHNVTAAQTGAAPLSHTHSGSDITTGTIDDARIPSSIARDSELTWGNLANIPSGFADNIDNDTTYSAGTGISIIGNSINNTGDVNPSDDLTTSTSFSGDVNGTYNSLNLQANVVTSDEISDGSIKDQDLTASLVGSGTATTDTSIRRYYLHQLNGIERIRVKIVCNGELQGNDAVVGIYYSSTTTPQYEYTCPGSGGRPWTYISPVLDVQNSGFLDVKYRLVAGGRFYWRTIEIIPVRKKVYYYSVGAEGFQPAHNVDFNNSFGTGGAYISTGAFGVMVHDLNLPQGARLTAFTMYFYDIDPTYNITVTLQTHGYSATGYVNLATLQSTGSSGMQNSSTELIHTVDKTVKSYSIRAYSTIWNSNQRIMGAVIAYELDE